MLEEKILAKQAGERFDTVSVEYGQVAGYKMSLPKCYSMWDTTLCPYVRERPTGTVSVEEIAALGLEYECAGCGRSEASIITKRNHETHCPYLTLIKYWDNPSDPDGEWPVQAVLAMRGPPNRRFVQLQWAEPEDDQDTTEWEYADLLAEDGTANAGDGTWKS